MTRSWQFMPRAAETTGALSQWQSKSAGRLFFGKTASYTAAMVGNCLTHIMEGCGCSMPCPSHYITVIIHPASGNGTDSFLWKINCVYLYRLLYSVRSPSSFTTLLTAVTPRSSSTWRGADTRPHTKLVCQPEPGLNRSVIYSGITQWLSWNGKYKNRNVYR